MRRLLALLAVMGLANSAPVTAAPLGPGESLSPPASVASPAGFTNQAFQNAGILEATFAGEWLAVVLSNDSSNPYGGLTFVYVFTKIGQSTGASELVLEGFSGFQTDAGYDAVPLQPEAKAPTFIGRDATGDLITADFPGFDPNVGFMSTSPLLIRTDATAWKSTSAFLTDGSTAVLPSFGPAVPEPSTWLLATMAAVGCWAMRQRR